MKLTSCWHTGPGWSRKSTFRYWVFLYRFWVTLEVWEFIHSLFFIIHVCMYKDLILNTYILITWETRDAVLYAYRKESEIQWVSFKCKWKLILHKHCLLAWTCASVSDWEKLASIVQEVIDPNSLASRMSCFWLCCQWYVPLVSKFHKVGRSLNSKSFSSFNIS